MKKLLVFSKNKEICLSGNAITGGQIYDYRFVLHLKNFYNGDISFEDDQTYGVTGNKLMKIYGYIKSAEKIAQYDYLIVNSSNIRLSFILKKIHKYHPEIKIIMIHHHFEYLSQFYLNPKRILIRIAEKYMLRESDLLIIPNQYPYDIAVNKMKISENKIYQIGSSFDKKKTYKLSRYNHGELLYVGTIERRKGIHILIQALEELKEYDFHMHFVGKYDNNDRYYKKIKNSIAKSDLKEKITFHGRVSDNELHQIYAESSVFIFPSLNEGYGLVILEAMAHGLPVVAFNNTAMPLTIVDQVNGFLVKNKDYKELARRIKELLHNDILVKEMGKNAILTFEKTKSHEVIQNEIKEFVNKVLI